MVTREVPWRPTVVPTSLSGEGRGGEGEGEGESGETQGTRDSTVEERLVVSARVLETLRECNSHAIASVGSDESNTMENISTKGVWTVQ
jgi:hypothetical protein